MLSEIGLFVDSCGRGPGKVRDNLIKGLEKLGVKVFHNEEKSHTGWLHGIPPLNAPENWLIGPNTFVIPTDLHPSFWERCPRNVVTPAKWTTDLYSNYISSPHKIYTWAVGIDTERFVPSDNKTNDCLIYVKGDPFNLKDNLIEKLSDLNLSYEQIEYGSYQEEELIEKAQASRFCVTLTRNESQGIAYQEILSMNVPCYIVDKLTWDDRPGVSVSSSSAPYFDGRCGVKTSDLSSLDFFMNHLENYKPREYIMNTLSLEKCASEYIELLEMINGK